MNIYVYTQEEWDKMVANREYFRVNEAVAKADLVYAPDGTVLKYRFGLESEAPKMSEVVG